MSWEPPASRAVAFGAARSRCVHRSPAVSDCARTYSGQRPRSSSRPGSAFGGGLLVTGKQKRAVHPTAGSRRTWPCSTRPWTRATSRVGRRLACARAREPITDVVALPMTTCVQLADMPNARARLRRAYHLAAELLALYGNHEPTLLNRTAPSIPTVRAWMAGRMARGPSRLPPRCVPDWPQAIPASCTWAGA